jgi:hypothetical protein
MIWVIMAVVIALVIVGLLALGAFSDSGDKP